MRIISLLLLCVVTLAHAQADWALENESSSLHFISTKNQHVSEIHSFTKLQGTLSKSGDLSIEIDLASVETGIDIRNSRMREMLFNVADLPMASLQAKLGDDWHLQPVGSTKDFDVESTLQLNGKQQSLTLSVRVTRQNDVSFQVSAVKPVLIYANSFGLTDGIASLQKIAGLSSISLAVPVTFNVQFTSNQAAAE